MSQVDTIRHIFILIYSTNYNCINYKIMKRLIKIKGFSPQFEENKTDVVFNKVGLVLVNKLPQMWELNEQGTRLINKNDGTSQVILASIMPHKIGDQVQWGEKSIVLVDEIKLIRLSDITDDLASRTGIYEQSPGVWKHYSPEKFFPKKVLKTQDPGFPNYKTPTGSFHSLWCREHDILEIYANPWIWQIKCKNIK